VNIVERALNARRSSRRIEIKESVAADISTVRDVAALANSGGGAIVARSGGIDAKAIADKLREYTDFSDLQTAGNVLVVGEATTPIVLDGVVYFRHGAKSKPGTTDDLAEAIDRRVEVVRRSWQSALTTFVKSPVGSSMPVRIVDDPRAPRYGLVDYDKTHPFRQKEIIAAFNERAGTRINPFDLLSVRKVHEIDAKPDFSHKTLFGTRQYSAPRSSPTSATSCDSTAEANSWLFWCEKT